jgi:hypothetical protein
VWHMTRRFIFTLIVLLLIGAILNILIAWTCVAVSKSRMFNARRLGQLRTAQYDEEERLTKAGKPPLNDRYLALLFESRGTQLVMIDEDSADSPQPIRMTRHDAGWPALAMRAEQWRGVNGKPVISAGAKLGTLVLDYPALPVMSVVPPTAQAAPPTIPRAVQAIIPPPRQGTDQLLPLRPIWPGFAINTIFYAGIAWLCWLLFTMSMRTQRRLRGLCGRCAYPIGVSPVCTECGARVRAAGTKGTTDGCG